MRSAESVTLYPIAAAFDVSVCGLWESILTRTRRQESHLVSSCSLTRGYPATTASAVPVVTCRGVQWHLPASSPRVRQPPSLRSRRRLAQAAKTPTASVGREPETRSDRRKRPDWQRPFRPWSDARSPRFRPAPYFSFTLMFRNSTRPCSA